MTQNPFDEDIDRRQTPALKTHPMVLGQDGANLFAAGVADMDFKVAPAILHAMQTRLNHGVFGYEAVLDNLYPALINWYQTRHNWLIEQPHILRAPNILNSLAIAASMFTDAGDGIIVQPPVFFDFFDILRENNRQIISNPLLLENGRYTMDYEGLEQLASKPRTKMIYLCNPHNPVGRVWDLDELRRLGDICARHNVLVVADEIHGDITYSGHKYIPFASLGADYADNTITCISPAKTFNIASCCAAFTVISNPERRAIFQAENSRLTSSKNNAFASVAMQAAYTDGGAWLHDVLIYQETNLALVRHHLADIPEVTMIEPEGTFLVWLDFRELGLSNDDLTAFLRTKAGWATTRGQSFGVEGQGFTRLNIACTATKLENALKALAKAMPSG
jgi:cystathionine beta-lyase